MILLIRLSRLEGPDVLWLIRKSGGHTNMSQAKNKKKFALACSSACPAAVEHRWFQIWRFGSTPEKGDSFLSPNNNR